MKLIQFNKWFGPSRDAGTENRVSEYEELIAYATDLELDQALELVASHQRAFNNKFNDIAAITLRLIGVTDIGNCSADALGDLGVSLVEDLIQKEEEF